MRSPANGRPPGAGHHPEPAARLTAGDLLPLPTCRRRAPSADTHQRPSAIGRLRAPTVAARRWRPSAAFAHLPPLPNCCHRPPAAAAHVLHGTHRPRRRTSRRWATCRCPATFRWRRSGAAVCLSPPPICHCWAPAGAARLSPPPFCSRRRPLVAVARFPSLRLLPPRARSCRPCTPVMHPPGKSAHAAHLPSARVPLCAVALVHVPSLATVLVATNVAACGLRQRGEGRGRDCLERWGGGWARWVAGGGCFEACDRYVLVAKSGNCRSAPSCET